PHLASPHPFPTRRSSDLFWSTASHCSSQLLAGSRVASSKVPTAAPTACSHLRRRSDSGSALRRPVVGHHRAEDSRLACESAPCGDRKSTRLNSSHQIISY